MLFTKLKTFFTLLTSLMKKPKSHASEKLSNTPPPSSEDTNNSSCPTGISTETIQVDSHVKQSLDIGSILESEQFLNSISINTENDVIYSRAQEDIKTARNVESEYVNNSPNFAESSIESLSSNLLDMLQEVNLSSPPGIAGDFCKELARFEIRVFEEPRVIAALNILARMMAQHGLYDGAKSTFFGLVAALSASGKEAHQKFQELLLKKIGFKDELIFGVTSAKQVYEGLVNYEYPIYIIDECHTLFRAADAGTDFGAMDALLVMTTATEAKFPQKTFLECKGSIAKMLAQMKKDPLDDMLSAYRFKRMCRVIDRLNNNYWPDPYISIAAYSTPLNLDWIVNSKTIDSGLIGRPIFMRAADFRDELNESRDLKEPTQQLTERFKKILYDETVISMSEEATDMLKDIVNFFESNRNHKKLGALYARGREHVLRVSSLLAAETRMIDCAELVFAMRLFLNSIDSVNDVLDGKVSHELYPSAVATMKKICEKSNVSLAVLANKLANSNKHVRSFKKSNPKVAEELIQQALADGFLSQKGKLIGLCNSTATQ